MGCTHEGRLLPVDAEPHPLVLTLGLRCPTARGSVVWVYSCSGRAATMLSVGGDSGPAECTGLLMAWMPLWHRKQAQQGPHALGDGIRT